MDEEKEKREFDDIMWNGRLSLKWNETAKPMFLEVWLEAKRRAKEELSACQRELDRARRRSHD